MAKAAGCSGVVCSGREVKMIKQTFGHDFLAVTPGIRPAKGTVVNDDQRRITTPAQAIKEGSDFIVIGRPIRDAKDPVAMVLSIIDEIQKVV